MFPSFLISRTRSDRKENLVSEVKQSGVLRLLASSLNFDAEFKKAFSKQIQFDRIQGVLKVILGDFFVQYLKQIKSLEAKNAFKSGSKASETNQNKEDLPEKYEKVNSSLVKVQGYLQPYRNKIDQIKKTRAIQSEWEIENEPFFILSLLEFKLFAPLSELDPVFSIILTDFSVEHLLKLQENQFDLLNLKQAATFIDFLCDNHQIIRLTFKRESDDPSSKSLESIINSILSRVMRLVCEELLLRKYSFLQLLRVCLTMNKLNFQNDEFYRFVVQEFLDKIDYQDENYLKSLLEFCLEINLDFQFKLKIMSSIFDRIFRAKRDFEFGDLLFFLNVYLKYENELLKIRDKNVPLDLLEFLIPQLIYQHLEKPDLEHCLLHYPELHRQDLEKQVFSFTPFSLLLVNNFVTVLHFHNHASSDQFKDFLSLIKIIVFKKLSLIRYSDLIDFIFSSLQNFRLDFSEKEQKLIFSKLSNFFFVLNPQQMNKLLYINHVLLKNKMIVKKSHEALINSMENIDKSFLKMDPAQQVEHIRSLVSLLVYNVKSLRILKGLTKEKEETLMKYINMYLRVLELKQLNELLIYVSGDFISEEFMENIQKFVFETLRSEKKMESLAFEDLLFFLEWVLRYSKKMENKCREYYNHRFSVYQCFYYRIGTFVQNFDFRNEL